MTGGAHDGKALPRPDAGTRPYWDGCRQHRLLLQRCVSCGRHQFYPRDMCHHCMGDDLAWVDAAGTGTVASFTVVRRPVSAAYAAETPYVVALIRLLEGPTMMSNIVGCNIEDVSIGQAVEVVFEDWSPEFTIPKFRPVAATS